MTSKHKKHRQFPQIVSGGHSYIVAGGVVVPAWPSYMYMDGLGGVTGSHLPPCCDSPNTPGTDTGSGASPTAGDGVTGSAAAAGPAA